MSDFLTQEELDALLQSGLGNLIQEEEKPKPQTQPYQPTDFYSPPKSRSTEKTSKLRSTSVVDDEAVAVQPAVFQNFDDDEFPEEQTNLEIILNLGLEIRVELGKTTATVGEVLKLVKNSVLELNKLNGEPVDLLVNGKPFSKGEMIVIGENFGVRVTDILSVPEIIEALGNK
jgi:flagellar motor switch protein FliN/FliY